MMRTSNLLNVPRAPEKRAASALYRGKRRAAAVAIAALAASLASSGSVADRGPGQPFKDLQEQIQVFQESMEHRLSGMDAKLDTLQVLSAQIHTQQALLEQKLDSLALSGGLVPFRVQAAGGLCDSGPSPSSNPQILIEGEGKNLFVVTSVLLKTARQALGEEGYVFLSVNSVTIDGTLFDTVTGNALGPVAGWGVDEATDLMGMPTRIAEPVPLTNSPRTESPAGGRFPHQIVADSEGATDIRIVLFCRADTHDLGIDVVQVSGWRSPEDSVTVSYRPGN